MNVKGSQASISWPSGSVAEPGTQARRVLRRSFPRHLHPIMTHMAIKHASANSISHDATTAREPGPPPHFVKFPENDPWQFASMEGLATLQRADPQYEPLPPPHPLPVETESPADSAAIDP